VRFGEEERKKKTLEPYQEKNPERRSGPKRLETRGRISSKAGKLEAHPGGAGWEKGLLQGKSKKNRQTRPVLNL